MPSDYLTLEQVCDMLTKTPTDVKGLVAEGHLRELHDAGKVFYKRSEVLRIAEKEGSSIVNLTPPEDVVADQIQIDDADSFASALSSLADSSSSLGVLDDSPQSTPAPKPTPGDSAFGDVSPALELSLEDFPEELPAAPLSQGTPELSSEIDLLPDDDAPAPKVAFAPKPAKPAPVAMIDELEVPDLGLSGSSIISLEPDLDDTSVPKAAPPKPAKPAKEEAKPAAKGISVFDDDELNIETDPMGETRISSGVDELEAVGSGSGLLDITQESDDTSLGAELLDVISPSAETETEVEVVEAAETVEDSGVIAEATSDEAAYEPAAAVRAPVAVRRAPAGAMTGAVPANITLGLGIAAMAMVGLAVSANLQGVWPAFLEPIARGVVHMSVFGGLAAVAIGVGVWSIMAGRK
jgi:hypothetical protein